MKKTMSNLDELIDTISDDATPVKVATRPATMSAGWMLAIFLYILMFISVVGIREDISTVLEQPLFILELFMVFLTIVSTSVAASFGAFPDRARSTLATWAPIIPLTIFLAVIGLQYFNSIGQPDAHEVGETACMGWVCMLSLLPATGLFLLLSRGICLYPRTTFTYAALAATMTAYLVLRLEEPYVTPMHVILTHIFPMIILIIIASFVARLKIFSPLRSRSE